MLTRIHHSLIYTYSREVFCEPVLIRLRPRDDAAQRLIRWNWNITPQPAGFSEFRDLDGNHILKAWFEGLTSTLSITSECEVETRCRDPYKFLLNPDATVLPVRIDPIEQSLAAYYSKSGTLSHKLVELAEDLERQTGRQTIRFLGALTAHLRDSFTTIRRPTGEPWPAEKTLTAKSGSCRDLAVLMCELCRAVGLPSRFVSGYTIDPDDTGLYQLHAWMEAYLPGAGWRGFDPTTGCAVSNRHIALAAARHPSLASPTSGVFRGTGVSSDLVASVQISTHSLAEDDVTAV